MSHHSDWQPEAGKLLEKIVEEISLNADQTADKDDLITTRVSALQRAVGPIFESFKAGQDGYIITQTRAQANFLCGLIGEMLALISAGFDARIEDQALNSDTDESLDRLINRFGSEDYPLPVKKMIAMGQEPELKAMLSTAMKNAAASEGDAFFDKIAESAIKRSSASSRTLRIMSMFHGVVEVLIADNRRRIQTSRGPIEATIIDGNVYQVQFGSAKAKPDEGAPPPAIAK